MSADLVPVVSPRIELIRITNPFDPREHVRESLAWTSDHTLAQYFPVGSASVVLSVNGRLVPQEEFPLTYLAPGDNVVVCPIPHGGKGGKSILSMIAMIAVAAFAPAIAGSLGGALGVTSKLGLQMLTVGVTMAGSMLVNSLFAPSRPSSAVNSASVTSSYGIDGAKNTAGEGALVPVLYGQFRVAGNIVNLHVENDGDAQILYMRSVLSEGRITSVRDIQINDQDIANFIGIETDIRLGDANQSVMQWFSDSVTPTSVGLQLTEDWLYATTGSANTFRIDVVAPNGLFYVSSDGSTSSVSVGLEFDYRKAGTTDAWVRMPLAAQHLGNRAAVATIVEEMREVVWGGREGGSYYVPTGVVTEIWTWQGANTFGANASYSSQGAGATITDVQLLAWLKANKTMVGTTAATASVAIYATSPGMTDNKRATVRRSFKSTDLVRQAYEVRMRRTSAVSADPQKSDAVFVSDVNSIQFEDIAVPHTAMLGVKIKLSEQITSAPKITALCNGIAVWVNRQPVAGGDPAGWNWYLEYSNNPAWIVWDILTNTRFGGSMRTSRLDLPAFREFAQHCADNSLTWNGVFDGEMNVWDASQLVLRVGHAQIVGVGTRYTVVIERAATPEMMFSVANMIEGTFSESWLPLSDRANEIEVTYFDKDDAFKQRTVKVYDPVALAAGRPQRTAAITLTGVTDYQTAFKEGVLQLNLNRYIQQTVEFSAPLEALACSVGSLVYVQHDMPQWGYAGRFEAASTASVLQLDRPVPFTVGKQYKALAVFDAIQRASGTVTSVAGTSVFLAGYAGTSSVKRFKFGSLDRKVESIFDQGGGAWGVVLEDASGITAAGAYTLWDTDVIEERDVVNPGTSEVTAVTLQSPMTVAPAQFAHWMFGEVDKVKKPFRIKAINGSHDYRRDIVAIEYNASVYDLSGTAMPTPNYSALDGAGVQQVISDGVEEVLFVSGATFRTHVTVHFHSDQSTYYRSAVSASVNGGPFTLIDPMALDRATIDLEDGDLVEFRIVPRDVVGAVAAAQGATRVSHTVVGKLAPPPVFDFFLVKTQPDGTRQYNFGYDNEAAKPIDWRGAEIRYVSGTVVDPDWATMTQLQDNTTHYTASPVELNSPLAGEYTFACRSVDTSGLTSALLVRSITLPERRLGNVYSEYFDGVDGWPGAKTSLESDGAGGLDALDTGTWDSLPDTWDAWERWSTAPVSPVYYETPGRDLLTVVAGQINSTIDASGTVLQEIATSADNVTWSAWSDASAPFSARYIKMRLRITATVGEPVPHLRAFSWQVNAPMQREYLNDLAPGSFTGSYRIAVGDVRIPLQNTYVTIKNTQTAVQDNRAGSWTWTRIDQALTYGPRWQFRLNGTLTDPQFVDFLIEGY